MDVAQTDTGTVRKELRLWPGVAAVVVQWLLWMGAPMVTPDAALVAVAGGLLGGVAVLVWWAFFSRAPRIGALGRGGAGDRRGGRNAADPG